MGKVGRLFLGLGILALGLCAALPFRRHEAVSLRRSTAGVPSTGLNVRGQDAPASSLQAMPLLAMDAMNPASGANAVSPIGAREVSDSGASYQPPAVSQQRAAAAPDAVNRPRTGAVVTPLAEAFNASPAGSELDASTQTAPLPAISDLPRLDRPSAIPRIAETFDQAIESRRAAELSGYDVRVEPRLTPPTTPQADTLPTTAQAISPVRLGAPVPWTPGLPPTAVADGNLPPQGPPTPAAVGPLQSETAPPGPMRKHRIRDGDTLPVLARRYLGDAARANEIFEANRQLLSRPDILPLGKVLQIPVGP
jgi:nucleoid-associated protein YgaU